MSLYFRGQCIDNRLPDLRLDPPDDPDPIVYIRRRCWECGRFFRAEEGAYRIKPHTCDTCADGGPF